MNKKEDTRFNEITKGLEDIKQPLKDNKKENGLIKIIVEENRDNGLIAITKVYK